MLTSTPSTSFTKNRSQTQKITPSVFKDNLSNPDVVVISESELQRIKNLAVITTKEQQLYQKKLLEEQKLQQQEVARAKKQRMLYMEEEKKKQISMTQTEQENQDIKNSLLARDLFFIQFFYRLQKYQMSNQMMLRK